MDRSTRVCCSSIAATLRAASEHLCNVLNGPWYPDKKLSGDVAHTRFHVELLQALIDFQAAELRRLSHSCPGCKCDPETGTDGACATTLATAVMEEAQDKLKEMESIAASIKNTSDMLEKLEKHLETYDSIRESLNIILPDDGTKYSFTIDVEKGVNLVIQAPNRCPCKTDTGTEPPAPCLIDTDPLLLDTTEVLEPASSAPDSSTLVPSEPTPTASSSSSSLAIAVPGHFEGAPASAPEAVFTEIHSSIPRPRSEETQTTHSPPILETQGSFDTDTNIDPPDPLYWCHGIQYRPRFFSYPSSSTNNKNNKNNNDNNNNNNPTPNRHSHMVIFTNLHPETTARDILSKVRGGAVLRAVRASPSVAFVTFARAADAAAYVSFINARTRPLSIRGRDVAVALATTASYPTRDELVHHATRCLAIERYSRGVAAFVARRRACGFVEATRVDGTDESKVGFRAARLLWAAAGGGLEAEEWANMEAEARGEVEVDDKKLVDAGVPVLVSFRDVAFAQVALETLQRWVPCCGVRYAPDRCAGPLSELEETI
ncbi:hypothetical protein F5Y14DRAFT_291457 [Nemania sp. NC0429]|nr:hypothetical protein F5Y14DRAFT_291457 [Nemania sp. NC0429]